VVPRKNTDELGGSDGEFAVESAIRGIKGLSQWLGERLEVYFAAETILFR